MSSPGPGEMGEEKRLHNGLPKLNLLGQSGTVRGNNRILSLKFNQIR